MLKAREASGSPFRPAPLWRFERGLLTHNFVPPAGEEDDFATPANFVDWVELFNDGGTPQDVSGWSLTDARSEPGKWKFPPNTVIAPASHLLVLCDDREEANA